MNQITNEELYSKLETLINKNTSEIKAEIKTINDTLSQKLQHLEEKCKKIEERIIHIERFNRKNNIVIFGILTNNENLLNTTLEQLNSIFDCNLTYSDINNIHRIGNKNTIVVEFISFLKKKKYSNNSTNWKGLEFQ